MEDINGRGLRSTLSGHRRRGGVHLTDTMEETAFLVDLHHDDDRPVIFTGAQRTADHQYPDGPGNLTAALTAAVDPANRRRGVLIAFGGALLPARGTYKAHTQLDAFRRWPDDDPVTRHVLPWNTLSDIRVGRRSLSRRRRHTHRRLRIGSRPRHRVNGIGLRQHQPDRRGRCSTRKPGRSHRGRLKPSAAGPLDRLLRRRWRWTRPPDRRSDPRSHPACRASPSAPHSAHRRAQHSPRDRRRFAHPGSS